MIRWSLARGGANTFVPPEARALSECAGRSPQPRAEAQAVIAGRGAGRRWPDKRASERIRREHTLG